MTVIIAAKYKEGTLCCSDSAITAGQSFYLHPDIKGAWWGKSFLLFAGALYWAQEVLDHPPTQSLKTTLRDVWEKFDDKEEDGAEFIEATHGGDIYIWEANGARLLCGDFMAAGSGGDIARALLKRVYKKDMSLTWLTRELTKIVEIVAEENVTVRGPARFVAVERKSKR